MLLPLPSAYRPETPSINLPFRPISDRFNSGKPSALDSSKAGGLDNRPFGKGDRVGKARNYRWKISRTLHVGDVAVVFQEGIVEKKSSFCNEFTFWLEFSDRKADICFHPKGHRWEAPIVEVLLRPGGRCSLSPCYKRTYNFFGRRKACSLTIRSPGMPLKGGAGVFPLLFP